MNNKKVDKTKKSNIKCEHCKYWMSISGNKNKTANDLGCLCFNSPKYNNLTWYWNRCKFFEWKEGQSTLWES